MFISNFSTFASMIMCFVKQKLFTHKKKQQITKIGIIKKDWSIIIYDTYIYYKQK